MPAMAVARASTRPLATPRNKTLSAKAPDTLRRQAAELARQEQNRPSNAPRANHTVATDTPTGTTPNNTQIGSLAGPVMLSTLKSGFATKKNIHTTVATKITITFPIRLTGKCEVSPESMPYINPHRGRRNESLRCLMIVLAPLNEPYEQIVGRRAEEGYEPCDNKSDRRP